MTDNEKWLYDHGFRMSPCPFPYVFDEKDVWTLDCDLHGTRFCGIEGLEVCAMKVDVGGRKVWRGVAAYTPVYCKERINAIVHHADGARGCVMKCVSDMLGWLQADGREEQRRMDAVASAISGFMDDVYEKGE